MICLVLFRALTITFQGVVPAEDGGISHVKEMTVLSHSQFVTVATMATNDQPHSTWWDSERLLLV